MNLRESYRRRNGSPLVGTSSPRRRRPPSNGTDSTPSAVSCRWWRTGGPQRSRPPQRPRLRVVSQPDVAEVLAKPISLELLDSSIPARLAYIGVDGDPRVVPVAFLWDGIRLTVCTVPKSAKVRALQRNPRVAITIDTEGQPPRVLLIRKEATVEMVDGVPDEYIAASRKLVPAEMFDAWEAGVRALYAEMAKTRSSPTGPNCWTSRPPSRRRWRTWSRRTGILDRLQRAGDGV